MSLYNSFARLGRKLEHSVPLQALAWPWRNYDGLQPQSYHEWMITREQNAPMAWVWCQFRAVQAGTDLELESRPQAEAEPSRDAAPAHAQIEAPAVTLSQDNSQDNAIAIGDMARVNLHDVLDDDEIDYSDILKLIASLAFAASVIVGIFLIPVDAHDKAKPHQISQVGKKLKNNAVTPRGLLK